MSDIKQYGGDPTCAFYAGVRRCRILCRAAKPICMEKRCTLYKTQKQDAADRRRWPVKRPEDWRGCV